MAVSRGKVATFEVSSDGTTYSSLGKRLSGSYSIDTDILDSTNADSGGKEGVYGDEQMKVDFSARYDPTDTAQALLKTLVASKAAVYLRVRERVGAGLGQFTFQAKIPGLSVDTPNDGVQEMNVSALSDGTITRSTQ